jgi:hypothetical protein
MPTIEAIEQAVRDRLQAAVPTVAVQGWPDRPEAYVLKHALGALLVRYTGSRFDRPETTDVMVQTQTIQVEVAALMRALRTHEGLYALLDAARHALTGFRAAGCSAMHPTRETFTDYAEGVWQYTIEFACEALHTEPAQTRPRIEFSEGEYALDQPTL